MRSPYNVGKFVHEKTGRGSSAWSQIYYGEAEASAGTLRAFVEAFDLDDVERLRLFNAFLSGAD